MYASSTHIARYLNQKRKPENGNQLETKRLRRSEEHHFNFRKNCLFFGEGCNEKHKKHPDRWNLHGLACSRCSLSPQDCKTLFLHSKYVELVEQSSDTNEIDIALEYVKSTIKCKQHEKEVWNSVEIYNMYSENGGHLLSRRNLISALVDYFGKETVLLSSPGVASILVFRKFCHFNLQNTDDIE